MIHWSLLRLKLWLRLLLWLWLRWWRQRPGDRDGHSSPHQLCEEARRVAGIVEPAVEAAVPLQTCLRDCLLKVAPPSAEDCLEGDPEVDPPVEIGRLGEALEAAFKLKHCAAVPIAPSDDGKAVLGGTRLLQPRVVHRQRLLKIHAAVDLVLPDSRQLEAERRGWCRGHTYMRNDERRPPVAASTRTAGNSIISCG